MQGFTFKLCEDIVSGKIRKNKAFAGLGSGITAKAFFRHVTIVVAGANFAFEYGTVRLATITPDDVITLTAVCDGDMSAQSRVAEIISLGKSHWSERWHVRSDRSRHSHCEQPIRIWHGAYWVQDANNRQHSDHHLPFTAGMQFRDGDLLNPEICVERKKRTDRTAVKEMKEILAPMRKLMHTLARIGAFHTVADEKTGNRSWVGTRALPHDIDYSEPTVADAERLFLFAFSHSYRNWGWHGRDEADRNKVVKAAVNYALAAVRKAYYSEVGAISFVEVDDGQDNRKAA